jgi:clan AA aspartic protease (TIGR02281 family)
MITHVVRRSSPARHFRIIAMLVGVINSALAATIPMEPDHGTFVVPVVVNSQITLKFTIDSGAADVVIPKDVISTLIRTGTISNTDIRGQQEYQLADGSVTISRRVRLQSLRVGSIEVHDVIASVAPQAGSLLLGQSFLSRFASWSIDNEKHVLVLNQSPLDQSLGPSALSREPSMQMPKHVDPKWLSLGSYTDGGGMLYVDTSSIRIDGQQRVASLKVEFSARTQRGILDPNKWMKLTAFREAVDCSREIVRDEEMMFYYEDGSEAGPPPGSLPTRWDTVSPVGASGKMLSAICKDDPRNSDR